MIVENLHIKHLKCKYLEKYVHVLHGITLLHNIMYLSLYVHETHTIGIIYYSIHLIKSIWLSYKEIESLLQ